MTHLRTWTGVGASLALALSLAGHAAAQEPPQAAIFRSGVDVIAVDLSAVDGSGQAVTDLTPADFSVRIDGQPRRVVSLELVRADPAAARRRAAAQAESRISRNLPISTGRWIVIAVDQLSVGAANLQGVLGAASRFLDGLGPDDQVALFAYPAPGPVVTFTTNHERIRTALARVAGHRPPPPGRLNIGLSEARQIADRLDTFILDFVVDRECASLRGVQLQQCRSDVTFEAKQLWSGLRNDAIQSLSALRQILATLADVDAPKSLVLISNGVFLEDAGELNDINRVAALSRVSVNVMLINEPLANAATAALPPTPREDRDLMTRGLGSLAAATRGLTLDLVGTGDNSFRRLNTELQAYYLMGVERLPQDADGKAHGVNVNVSRRGVTVRARRQFLIEAPRTVSGNAPLTPTDRVIASLRRATLDTAIPVSVTTYAMSAHPDTSLVRIVVAADVGAAGAAPDDATVGFVLVDESGAAASSWVAEVHTTAADAGRPLHVATSLDVAPGPYTLRVAAVDADNRAGSVHHPVSAQLAERGGVKTSDILVSRPTNGELARVEVQLRLEEPTLQAYVELGGSDVDRLREVQVRFDVAPSVTGAALALGNAVLSDVVDAHRTAIGTVDVQAIAPGSYVARAVVTSPGQAEIVTTRPFEILPRTAKATPLPIGQPGGPAVAETPRAPVAAAAPVPAVIATPPVRARPVIPRLNIGELLAPAVVAPFLDRIAARYAPSAAARESIAQARAGALQNISPAGTSSEVGLAFTRGLRQLEGGQVAQASNSFKAALRQAPDFLGLAFYVGVCLAAAGSDGDAVGAFRTALIGDVGAAAIYPALVDALLRLGDGQQALSVLDEAKGVLKDRAQQTRRLAQAYALTARYADARRAAHEHLTLQANDLDILYLAMQLIYEARTNGDIGPASDELSQFRQYADRYSSLKGPRLATVTEWRMAIAQGP